MGRGDDSVIQVIDDRATDARRVLAPELIHETSQMRRTVVSGRARWLVGVQEEVLDSQRAVQLGLAPHTPPFLLILRGVFLCRPNPSRGLDPRAPTAFTGMAEPAHPPALGERLDRSSTAA